MLAQIVEPQRFPLLAELRARLGAGASTTRSARTLTLPRGSRRSACACPPSLTTAALWPRRS
jgi:hypothetical protein